MRRSKSLGATGELRYSTHNLERIRRLPSIRRSYCSGTTTALLHSASVLVLISITGTGTGTGTGDVIHEDGVRSHQGPKSVDNSTAVFTAPVVVEVSLAIEPEGQRVATGLVRGWVGGWVCRLGSVGLGCNRLDWVRTGFGRRGWGWGHGWVGGWVGGTDTVMQPASSSMSTL